MIRGFHHFPIQASLLVSSIIALCAQAQQQQQPATRPATATTAATKPIAITRPATTRIPATATAPTTTAAVPSDPPPPPKAVVLAFAAAIGRGDAAAAKALVVPDDSHGQWVDSTLALAASLNKLDAASVAKFGEPGRKVSQNALGMTAALSALDQGQEKITGDGAVVNGTIHLRRGERGRWLIELPTTDAERTRRRMLYDLLVEAAEQTAAEVAAGRHPTLDAARTAFEQRALRARVRAG